MKKIKHRHPDAEKLFCCYCERWLIYPLQHTKEHVSPRSHYSLQVAMLAPCCHVCNTWRANKTYSEWYNEVDMYKLTGKGELFPVHIGNILKNIKVFELLLLGKLKVYIDESFMADEFKQKNDL